MLPPTKRIGLNFYLTWPYPRFDSKIQHRLAKGIMVARFVKLITGSNHLYQTFLGFAFHLAKLAKTIHIGFHIFFHVPQILQRLTCRFFLLLLAMLLQRQLECRCSHSAGINRQQRFDSLVVLHMFVSYVFVTPSHYRVPLLVSTASCSFLRKKLSI